MKFFIIAVSLLACASADVSHLLHGDHHSHQHEHEGYNYEPPSVRFEEPKPTYLPPEKPTPPTPTYLPPEPPAVTYLPPQTTRRPPPPPPRTTTPRPPPPPPAPKQSYLPPAEEKQQKFEIPLPSYADSFLEPDSVYLPPAQPDSMYLPPEQPAEKHSADGYHYDAPAKRFRF